jgi:WhiB family redox-sensing transcriptional regulator
MTTPKAKRNPAPPIHTLPHRKASNLGWMEQAACQNADPQLFFPETSNPKHVEAVTNQYCKNCPVKNSCHQYGKDIKATTGIFGGVEFLTKSQLRNRAGSGAGAEAARRYREKKRNNA